MTKSVKIIVHVPVTHSDVVIRAMGDAGAGRIGNYTHCSFRALGTGMFLPVKGAQPAVGGVGTFEEVAEEQIEMTCGAEIIPAVIAAIKKAHPYEEPVYDIYERLNYE